MINKTNKCVMLDLLIYSLRIAPNFSKMLLKIYIIFYIKKIQMLFQWLYHFVAYKASFMTKTNSKYSKAFMTCT